MIELVEFTYQDFDQLISWVNSKEELMQFAGPAYQFPLTKDQLLNSLADPNRKAFKVIMEQKPIGHCELYETNQSFFLGRILIGHLDDRGKGLGGLIVQQLLDYGFSHYNKDKAELNVFEQNKRAIDCYKKAGLTINPDIRLERKVNTETWIAINMFIPRIDWESRSHHH